MDPKERSFHDSHKPSWGPNATLVYAIPGKVGISQSRSTQTNPILSYRKDAIVSEGRDVRFATLANAPNVSALCPAPGVTASTHAYHPHSSFQKHSSNNAPTQRSSLIIKFPWQSCSRLHLKTWPPKSSQTPSTKNQSGSSHPSSSTTKIPKITAYLLLKKAPTTIASAKTA